MNVKSTGRKSGNVSDAAVRAATGKNWNEWFSILDRAGARRMIHKEIVAVLGRYRNLSGWWRQMITVAYERDRGLRVKHERPDGFSVSRSRTLPVPVESLYDRWADARSRARWLGRTRLTVRRATRDKSIRISWANGKTNVEVNFYRKGETKSQVTVQHNKLASSAAADKMKAFWGEALDALERTTR